MTLKNHTVGNEQRHRLVTQPAITGEASVGEPKPTREEKERQRLACRGRSLLPARSGARVHQSIDKDHAIKRKSDKRVIRLEKRQGRNGRANPEQRNVHCQKKRWRQRAVRVGEEDLERLQTWHREIRAGARTSRCRIPPRCATGKSPPLTKTTKPDPASGTNPVRCARHECRKAGPTVGLRPRPFRSHGNAISNQLHFSREFSRCVLGGSSDHRQCLPASGLDGATSTHCWRRLLCCDPLV